MACEIKRSCKISFAVIEVFGIGLGFVLMKFNSLGGPPQSALSIGFCQSGDRHEDILTWKEP